MDRIIANFNIALEAVLANKVRSILTALGIIFGVAAVIAMLAIGNGAQKEILEQIKLVGVNNIVITPVVEQSDDKLDGESEKKETKFTPGLTLADAFSIKSILPEIEAVSPEIVLDTYLVKNARRRSAKLVGVEPAYFSLTNFYLLEGKMFNEYHIESGEQVCIIGKQVATQFFSGEKAIGKRLKVGKHWLTVIGVLEERIVSDASQKSLGLRDFNMDVYAPVKTVLIRYKNRGLVTKKMIEDKAGEDEDEENSNKKIENYHQIDRLVIQVKETEYLSKSAEVVSRLLTRRHNNVVDFEVSIPELLLKQQQKTKDIFNVVLGAIAGISLLVGGIGIMNIMLASVLERIKEIGVRLSIGAKKKDIITQFLIEAVMISVSGGVIGIIFGVTMAIAISQLAEIPTIISPVSIFISFGVAASIGLLFGIAPARKAANQDPITSLRYE